MSKHLHEHELIGAILLDPNQALYACNRVGLQPKHFITSMKVVYETVQRLNASPKAVVDIINVAEQSGISYDELSELLSKCHSVTSAQYHAEEVIKYWKGSEALRMAGDLVKSLKDGAEYDKAMMEFWQASQSINADNLVDITKIKDHKQGKLDQWKQAKEQGFVGVPSSIKSINSYLGGWRKSLGLIGAYRGTGKSTFIAQEALWQAQQGFKVAIFTLEDPVDMIAARMAGNHGDVSTFHMDIGTYADFHYENIASAFDAIGELPVWIVGKCRTMPQLISTANMLKQRHGLDIIYIDHIQLISPLQLPDMNRTNTLATYSAQLADLAGTLECPVVCASQLSRDCERAERKPKLSDLRDSGSLEQDCRQCLLLYRVGDDFMLEVAKNNYGISGKDVKMERLDGKQRFEERTA
jgi:replicative DNA helicase